MTPLPCYCHLGMLHDCLIILSQEYADATNRYGILMSMTQYVIRSIGHCNMTLNHWYNQVSMP